MLGPLHLRLAVFGHSVPMLRFCSRFFLDTTQLAALCIDLFQPLSHDIDLHGSAFRLGALPLQQALVQQSMTIAALQDQSQPAVTNHLLTLSSNQVTPGHQMQPEMVLLRAVAHASSKAEHLLAGHTPLLRSKLSEFVLHTHSAELGIMVWRKSLWLWLWSEAVPLWGCSLWLLVSSERAEGVPEHRVARRLATERGSTASRLATTTPLREEILHSFCIPMPKGVARRVQRCHANPLHLARCTARWGMQLLSSIREQVL